MQTLPREDFPSLPEGGRRPVATLPRAALKEMVAKTQFAITGEDTRYFLNGAQFVLRPDSMSLVATDGHRLALVTATRDGKKDSEEIKKILPKKTLGELSRLLSDGDGDISVRARRKSPVLRGRRPPAHLAHDRRAVSGVRTRHSQGQRQAHRVRARSPDQRGQARGAALERTIASGQVPDREGQGRRDLEQPGGRRSPRNAAGRLHGRRDADLLQRPVCPGLSRRRHAPMSSRSN